MSLAKRVKMILNKTEETKYVAETLLDGRSGSYVNFNSTITTANDWYRVLPQLAQGADQSWVRDGADVSVMSQRIHWEFRFGRTDQNTRDIFCVLYVVQPVSQKAYGSSAVNGTMGAGGQFLTLGATGTSSIANQGAFNGVPLDSWRPIYKPLFRLLHKKVFKLSRSSGSANGSGVVGQYDGSGTGQYSTGNISKRHSWTNKHVPKVLKYNEGSGISYPTNCAPYWAVGYYYADGTNADTAGGLLNVSCLTEMTYKDD